jgi:DNA-binding GntR family transcriptional regulator
MTAAASKQEQAYATLRKRIVAGRYGPGYRLVLDALARDLGVSQMPVREAIRRLEAEGWIVYSRNQGAQVAPVDAHSWAEAMGILAVLEGNATALAAPSLTADDLAELRAANGGVEEALADLDVVGASDHNLRFHSISHARCPNAYMRRELTRIQERLNTLRNTIFLQIPTRGLDSVTEHAELIALLERRADPSEIEGFARGHKLHTVAAFEERLEETE